MKNYIETTTNEINQKGGTTNIMEKTIPIWEKYTLTVEEAAAYFNIGEHRIRNLVNENRTADFILWKNTRPNIKRKMFENYIDSVSVI